MDRARAFLNDQGAMIWNNQMLMPHARTAYTWLVTRLQQHDQLMYQKVSGTPYTPTDIVYTGGEVDLLSVLPADMWYPTRLEFRMDASQDWTEVVESSDLETIVAPEQGTIRQWMWRNRDIYVTPVTNNGLLRLTYMALVPPSSPGPGSSVLVDNAVECLAYFTAHSAYMSRGQAQQAGLMLGSDIPTSPAYMSGAKGFCAMLIDLLVKVRQLIATRGVPFDQGQYNVGSYGPLLY